jgi:hypothetical protein
VLSFILHREREREREEIYVVKFEQQNEKFTIYIFQIIKYKKAQRKRERKTAEKLLVAMLEIHLKISP